MATKKKPKTVRKAKRPKKPAAAMTAKPETSTNLNAEAPSPSESCYDVTFEILLRLAIAARRGRDIGALLVATVEENFPGLQRMPEFMVAMDVIPRPADAVVPWLLTVDESEVTPSSTKEIK